MAIHRKKKSDKRISVSLLISTYNSPKYLNLSVHSIFNQSVLPDEILIADDGSGEETRKLIEQLKRESPVPVRHVWHPDRGFRVGAIRNKAIHQAHGDYIIQIDGDIVVHPDFVADHIRFARRGSYVTGSRVVLTEDYTQHVFDTGNIHISLFAKGLRHRLNGLRMPVLMPFMTNYKSKNLSYVRGCNMAFWREDLIKTNGYNEDFEGWGCEDCELAIRLTNNGIKKRFIKFGGIAFHLYHTKNTRQLLNRNRAIKEFTLLRGIKWAPHGIVDARNLE